MDGLGQFEFHQVIRQEYHPAQDDETIGNARDQEEDDHRAGCYTLMLQGIQAYYFR